MQPNIWRILRSNRLILFIYPFRFYIIDQPPKQWKQMPTRKITVCVNDICYFSTPNIHMLSIIYPTISLLHISKIYISIYMYMYILYSIPEPSPRSLSSVLKIIEGEPIYDCCWYPQMSSLDPSTCCLLSTAKDGPIHMWDAFTGKVDCIYNVIASIVLLVVVLVFVVVVGYIFGLGIYLMVMLCYVMLSYDAVIERITKWMR